MQENLSAKEEYFKNLEQWINQTKLVQNATACFPYYLASNYSTYFSINGINTTLRTDSNSPVANSSPESTQTNSVSNNIPSRQISREDGGYEFVLAPLWKRFVAEVVDIVMLLLLKVAITFTLLNVFDIDLSYEFDSDSLKKSLTEDDSKFLSLADLLTLSSDLVALEILMKVFVCLYEAIWTMNGRVFIGGATPGKILLGIRIVYTEVLTIPIEQPAVNATGAPVRALLYPAANPGFRRAFFRALAKNLVLALLFPVCFVFLFLKNNRTFYDVLTKTVVVEENPAPVLRRR